MIKREEVVKVLRNVVEYNKDDNIVSGLVVISLETVSAALSWLECLDARLLTREEVEFDCPDVVCFETRSGQLFCCIKDRIESDYFVYFVYGRDRYFQRQYEFYSKTWRCWTHRPTEERRKAVKWDD